MTNDFPPKIRGFSTYVCRACEHVDDFPTHCVLRVPEFEGFYSATPSACPYKMTFEVEWEEVVEE